MWIPVVNDSSSEGGTCTSLESLRATSVFVPSPNFLQANLGLFTFLVILFLLITLPLCFVVRETSRFRRVRPLWSNLILIFSGLAVCCMTVLRLYLEHEFPCAILFIGYTCMSQVLGANMGLRVVVFICETLVQEKVGKQGKVLDDLDSNDDFSSKGLGHLYNLAMAAVGMRSFDDLQVADLVQIRHSRFLTLSAIMWFPATIALIVGVGITNPILFECRGCFLFTEIILCSLSGVVANFLFSLRLIYFGIRKFKLRDSQKVFRELFLITAVALPLFVLSLALEAEDPNWVDWSYNFAWEWITILSVLAYWIIEMTNVWASFRDEYRLTKSLRNFRFLKRFATSASQNPSTVISESRATRSDGFGDSRSELRHLVLHTGNEDEAKEFEKFARFNYCIELVQFLQDVDTFKRYYDEKDERWRLAKLKILISQYIMTGSDLEVNVSYTIKEDILSRVKAAENGRDSKFHNIFSEAEREVETMLDHGVYRRYVAMKKRKASKAGGALGHVVSMFTSTDVNTKKISNQA